LAVSLLAVGSVTAQTIHFGTGFLADLISQNRQLQDDLKMDKAQVDAVTRALAKVSQDYKGDLHKLRYTPRGTTPEQRAELSGKIREAYAKAIESVLKPDQFKRFRQIENQWAGLAAFFKPEFQNALKLTADQTAKLDSINENLKKDLRPFAQPRPREIESALKEREALRKHALDEARELLSDDQKATLKDLLGATFQLQPAVQQAASGGDVLYPLGLEVGKKGHFYGYGGSATGIDRVQDYTASVGEVLSDKEVLVQVQGTVVAKTLYFILQTDTKGLADAL
jgi:hypothetical protein